MEIDYAELFEKKYSISRTFASRVSDEKFKEPLAPVCKYGIPFLDDSLGGIYPMDVVLIGAKSGSGKTEFVVKISEQMAKAGKRVTLIALEADPYEVERRIHYKKYSKELFKNEELKRKFQPLNYRRFVEGKITDEDLYNSTLKTLSKELKDLSISYKDKATFDLDELKRHLYSSSSGSHVVILDHIHFIDMVSENENREMKEIISEIRSIALLTKTPIILVAHLRKSMSTKKKIIPDVEDFHGSSDLFKICTQAIILSPRLEAEREEAHLFPTYMRVVKNRKDGSSSRYVGLVDFNIETNEYNNEYIVGELNFAETEWIPTEIHKRPWWAL